MNVKKRIQELESSNWDAFEENKLEAQRDEKLELYKLLDWFLTKTTDDYLKGSESSVVKRLKLERPPRTFLKCLLEVEKIQKKPNKKVIQLIENELRK